LMFLPDHLFEDDKELQCCAWSLVPWGSFGRLYQWNATPVTYYHLWCSKPWKDHLLKHFPGMLSINSPTWHSFHPFGDVIAIEIYTRSCETLEKVPCGQCPIHQRVPLEDCKLVAWHRELRFAHASSNCDTFEWNPWCLHTLWANRNHSARSLLVCKTHHNALHMVLHDISQWDPFCCGSTPS
jgi:hypothetical protein